MRAARRREAIASQISLLAHACVPVGSWPSIHRRQRLCSGAEENFRPSPTAAAQIDDQAGTYAEVPEQIKNSRRSTGGKTAEADIVDVDEVFPIHLTHIPSIRACG